MERGDIVKLVYTPEDLEVEDFGMSGLVLQSPLEKLKYYLDYHFEFRGTLKENEDFVIITSMSGMHGGGTRLRDYLIHKSYLEKVENYECNY